MTNRCKGCLEVSDYQWCHKCVDKAKCPHGNRIVEGCTPCAVEGDLAFDAERENK